MTDASRPSPQTILIVEDEALVRLAAFDLAVEAGYEALEASNADEAIKILESREDIRLIFTDIDMPGTMDGLKLAAYVRTRWPPIKIVVASGKAVVEEGLLPAGSRFFSKPYRDDTLLGTLTELLSEARQDPGL